MKRKTENLLLVIAFLMCASPFIGWIAVAKFDIPLPESGGVLYLGCLAAFLILFGGALWLGVWVEKAERENNEEGGKK